MPARGAGQKYVWISDHPTRGDVRENVVWSDRKIVQLLHQAGMAEEDCLFTTLLKCAPVDGVEPTYEQGRLCLGYLLRELSAYRPKVAFVTGKLAFHILSKQSDKLSIGQARGQTYVAKMPWGDMHIVPTWSPGYARHKMAAGEDIVADIISGMALTAPERETDYRWIDEPEQLIRQVDEIMDLHSAGKLPFGFVAPDIESTNLVGKNTTPVPYKLDNNIGTIQIAWAPGKAFIVPVVRKGSAFNNTYNIGVLRKQLDRILSSVPVVGQNYKFDESYFRIKLGITTKNFVFDTMLGHHFLAGGSLPNGLDFLIPRYLGWPSHKRIIEAELDAMPDDDRRYSNMTQETLRIYGCKDADGTLQLAPILIDLLRSKTYEKYGRTVLYPNMYEAFKARTMFPWKAILDTEIAGAPVDSEQLPIVSSELKAAMDTAYTAVYDTPPHAVWLLDHTYANPKRKVFEKRAVHYLKCGQCSTQTKFVYEGKRPKTGICPVCKSEVKVTWKMEPTERFTIDESQPETLVEPINLKSPQQLSEFFYSKRYLGLPVNDDLGEKTDKKARAFLLDYCEKAGLDLHAKVLVSVADYKKAEKLYSAYAEKIPDYLFIKDEAKTTSDEVTSKFELNTGVNFLHTNYYQDGTVSGRLCVDGATEILTDKGLIRIDSLAMRDTVYYARTHRGRWRQITHLYYKGRERMLRIRTSSGCIECTPGHRMWSGDSWIHAGSLQIGDKLISASGDVLVADGVVSIEDIGVRDVWDITVEEDSSYVAGGLIHHNSTRKPSFHVIPRGSSIKTLFVSRFGKKGIILQNDLSQAEVRAFVIETGDDSLRDAFNNGVDPYIMMASKTYSVPMDRVTADMRQDNKSIVLGLLFGRGAVAIAEQIKKPVNEVRGIIASFFGGMPKLRNWIDKQHGFVDRFKCAVSIFGRVRPLVDEIDADDDEMLNHAHNVSVNHPIQGMVGDLCIDSFARIVYRLEARGLQSRVFNTVHDSTIIDVYIPELAEVMAIAREEMFTNLPVLYPWVNVPFAIDQELGLNWGKSAKATLKDGVLTWKGKPDVVNKVFSRLAPIMKFASVNPSIVLDKEGKQVMTMEAKL